MSEQSSNKRIAKNAMYLYIRTLVTTLVGIYTSRVVLQTLGVEDYGLYSVVGGVVGMFGFINGSMCSTTSRFITFEIGRGNTEKLSEIFCSAMVVHIVIALVVVILAETFGLWFLCNKLVIPEGRMVAAHWVYQLSVLSTVLSITQVPYDACMTAHERFDITASISLFSTFAKLGILYIASVLPYDHLISYAVFMLILSCGARLFSRFYSIRHYSESVFHWIIRPDLIKPMMSFSGWQMVGCMGLIANQQGKAMVVNMFYGVVVNAAVGIGQTVSGAVNGLAYNLLLAFQPSITKAYAAGRIDEFVKMVNRSAVMSFMLFSVFSIPLILELDYVLQLWLGIVPQYSASVCFTHLVLSNFTLLGIVLGYALGAIGRNRNQNIYSSSINFLSVVGIYVLCIASFEFETAYMMVAALQLTDILYKLYLYRCYLNASASRSYFLNVVLRLTILYIIHILILIPIKGMLDSDLLGCVIVCFISLFLSIVMLFFSGYRKTIMSFIISKISNRA